ncbi:MAG TPA: WecB/TagA/CpsF family glycosyltransferase [Nocardioidaceae bacterium]|nr:WecB/TagA/CpsF family glycosyltransferase [Nocardioidaceae bacterium]
MSQVVDEAVASRAHTTWAGVRLSTFSRSGFCDFIENAVEHRTGVLVTFLNPFYARATDRDPRLAATVDEFDVVQPDGWGVVYGARLAGIHADERIAIEDVERTVFGSLARRGGSVFLFGSEPGIAEAAGATLESQFPGLRVVGTQHGWLDVERGHPGRLDPDDARRVMDDAVRSGADILMVGLPTPLQQEWARDFGRDRGVPVVMTVGAYFDKLAEGLDWYPRWMERLRLGWTYRVYREPRRLLGRYTIGSAQFARLVTREAIRARRRAR